MDTRLSIGDFSRMTYLSVKALRHYHDIGLLAPADVDPVTGYRFYRPGQVPAAQVIRRLRDLGMPLDGVKAVLAAPDVPARNVAIVEHLHRMERQLEATQASVASLRALLEEAPQPIDVEYRAVAATTALAVVDGQVGMRGVGAWWTAAFDELHSALAEGAGRRAGPDGALYSDDFFQTDAGEVVAFVPVAGAARGGGRVRHIELPAVELAVTVHRGPFADLDKTYGALGTFVATRAIGVGGPIREHHLVSSYDTDDEAAHRTEVCWPVFRTTSGGSR